MAQQLINYGQYPDDANADAIRTAFLKVEQNFTDLYQNGVSGITSVNSGAGIVVRRTGSNVQVTANIYQVQLQSNANSMLFSLNGGSGANLSTYLQGTDVLTINPSDNFNLNNVYLSGNMYLQGAAATAPFVSRAPDGTAVFSGNGAGLTNIPLKPAAGGFVNQIQFVGLDSSSNTIITGSNNFTFTASGNLLNVSSSTSTFVAVSGNDGSIAATATITSANVFTNAVSNTFDLVVRNAASFLGNVTFTGPTSTTGASNVTDTTESTSTTTGALIVAGGVGVAKRLNVGGTVAFSNTLTVANTVTVSNTLTASNLITGGNISATGNATISGNATVSGTMTVGNTTVIAGQTSINNNISVTGNASVIGNAVIGGNANITGNSLISGTSNTVGNATFNGEIFITPTVAQTTQVIFANSTTLDGSANFTWNPSLNVLTLTGGDYTGTANAAVLQIAGGAEMSGNLYVGGKIFVANISGNNLSANDLSVAGNLSVTGKITAKGLDTQIQYNNSGNLDGALGFTYDVGTGAVTVANTFTGGNLITGGNANVTGNLVVTGYANINGTQLNVSSGAANAVYAGGQANVANIIARNLTATRVVLANLSSGLVDDPNLTFDGTSLAIVGNISATGNATITKELTVSGNSTITGNVTISTGDLTVSTGNVSIETGTFFSQGNITGDGILTINGTAANSFIAGNLDINSSLQVSANANINGNLLANNANIVNTLSANNANITNNVKLISISAQTGNIYFGDAAVANSSLFVTTTANIRGAAQFGSSITMEGTNTLTTRTITTGGSATTGTITGDWSLTGKFQATYADLAENYASDADYLPGTVLEFGGAQEVTIATNETSRLAGVVTTEPAYVLNSNIKAANSACIALVGRVPVKVTGYIHKGDMLVSAGNGVAKACSQPSLGQVIGKSLEDFASHSDQDVGIVTVAVSRH